MKKRKKEMTPSEMLENTTLGEIPCQGCGKLITVVLPFTGCPFCSHCLRGRSWPGTTEQYDYGEAKS